MQKIKDIKDIGGHCLVHSASILVPSDINHRPVAAA